MEYRLLIDTKDEKGLVYKISKILYNYDLNIIKTNEYVDKQTNKFFLRAVISGTLDKNKLYDEIKNILPKNTHIRLNPKQKKDIVLFATKETHCLGDILIRHHSGELNANIKAVVSNRDTLKQLVEKFNIEFIFVSSDNISREEHEEKIIKVLEKFDFQLIVLAKYMRILTPKFVEIFSQKILNIHHSFLPAFIGANPYKQAFNRGVKLIGATAHFVTNDLDEGPIVAQDIVSVNHNYSWQNMQEAGKDVEKVVLSRALNLILKDKVFIYENKTVVF
jgi:formyltetrahydrofolate deformylase